MNMTLLLTATFFISLFTGAYTGKRRIYSMTRKRTVSVKGWRYNLYAGTQKMNMYERACIAILGLFALNKTEAFYLNSFEDAEGKPLDCSFNYRLEGKDFDARWWSVTTYDKDHYLIENKLDRFSYNGDNLSRNDDGGYTIHLSQTPKEGNWLPVGREGKFSITIRLYNPSKDVYENPEKMELPRIIRE